jgi:hypothetical protein
LITCWSAKGGSGATTIAAALALSDDTGAEVTLVDLAGDLPAALGMSEPSGPGVSDALAAHPSSAPAALVRAARIELVPGVGLVPHGAGPLRGGAPMEAFVRGLHADGGVVVVDAGVVRPGSPALDVTRPCYLSVRRAVGLPVRPDAVVLVDEPGRSLGRRDVEAVLGVPVRAVVPFEPSIARAIDAGLLLARMPRSLSRALRTAA